MIDLNTATAADLDAVLQLKGYGFEIVRYREESGRFGLVPDKVESFPEMKGELDDQAEGIYAGV